MTPVNPLSGLPSRATRDGYPAATDCMEIYAHTDPSSPDPSDGTTVATRPRLRDCWAKTDESGRPCLSVRDHCLHVGAVAEMTKEGLPDTMKLLLPENSAALVAAHDIGKITPGFLMKCPIWRDLWQSRLGLDSPDIYEGNHAKTGQRHLAVRPEFCGKPPGWLIAVGGHHGKYTSTATRGQKVFEGDADWIKLLREELLEEICCTFGPLPLALVEKSARLHWFTGFMVFCDWIGSNTGWFPAEGMDRPTSAEAARAQARSALADIGWHGHKISADLTFGRMFQTSSGVRMEMRPLQTALVEAAENPGLYIVEAPMGEGKTEAALAVACRRWAEGGESGLYFALPTQLTSNRIHQRVEEFLANVLTSPSVLSLAHGNAGLSGRRITPVLPAVAGEDDGAAVANLWYSDSRKALLAPFGVGTLDQALMAVLPVKHSALRLFALGGKVIVMDEVHSYDPYTSALVDRAVGWFLEVGCTVIVLSATLTKARRAQLVAAAGAVEEEVSDAYPLITKVSGGSSNAQSISVPESPRQKKSIRIENRDREGAEWIREVASAAESGACVLVVRNTIAAAQECFDQLKSSCRDLGIVFGLLHSRFPQFRRDENEGRWMQFLGKGGEHRPKSGCILVGTQVVEQSVDIDADLLVTDLAPTDLLFQRIGRLHRHERQRPPGCEQPRCIILQPPVEWEADVALIKKSLGASAYVYPPFALFQAQRVWQTLSKVSLPKDIRPLLEESSRIPDSLPKGADALRIELEKLVEQMRGTAWMNTVFGTGAVEDVEGMQTRWKPKPSGFVILLQSPPSQSEDGISLHFLDGTTHAFVPGRFDFDLARKLHQNACRVPRYLIADALRSPGNPPWLFQHFPDSILAVCPSGTADCRPCHAPETSSYRLSYREERGLSHERNLSAPTFRDEEESWF
jgi:CRISPR-associated endonuclease/helicase Cas3